MLTQGICNSYRCLQVMVNEEVDPTLVIKRLKQEIRDLKDEIRFGLCILHSSAPSAPSAVLCPCSRIFWHCVKGEARCAGPACTRAMLMELLCP